MSTTGFTVSTFNNARTVSMERAADGQGIILWITDADGGLSFVRFNPPEDGAPVVMNMRGD